MENSQFCHSIELLSPAKNAEIGIAAINCGADAVYIGAEKFGARVSAGNTLSDIEKLVRFAHQYNAKVYITLNTILNDEELQEAEKLILDCNNIGVDAIIIQDFGILELPLPPIPLFASTQMDNSSPEKVLFLEKCGFSRVILARELSLPEIQLIREKTTIELEFFVHGALCVSHSGQCYFSQYLGRRSGNRGNCAQPCRNIYTLTDETGRVLSRNKHLLSIKDLSLEAHIPELLNCGITSFKIEGRLKDENYVKNVTAYYRKILDNCLDGKTYKKSSSGVVSIGFQPDIRKTFNRNYTSYRIGNDRDSLPSFDTPKSQGEYLGRVKNIQNGGFILENPVQVTPGDGICFLSDKNVLTGTSIHKIEKDTLFPDEIKEISAGIEIYRNTNHAFNKELKTAKNFRKIAVEVVLGEIENGFYLKMEDEDGNTSRIEFETEKILAENTEKSRDTIIKQLSRLGDSIFNAKKVIIETQQNYFFPVSLLNRLRRETTEALINKRVSRYLRSERQPEEKNYPYPERKLDYKGNVLNQKAVKFFKRHGVENIDFAMEHPDTQIKNPLLMTTRLCLRRAFKLCGQNKPQPPLFLTDNRGNRFKIQFDCHHCQMNIFPDKS